MNPKSQTQSEIETLLEILKYQLEVSRETRSYQFKKEEIDIVKQKIIKLVLNM